MGERAKLSNLVSGVSRQSAAAKESFRPDEQVNLVPHPAIGLMPRPGSERLGTLMASVGPGTRFHFTNTREDEQYVMALGPGGVRVWDLLGEEYLVSAPGGFGYLQGRTGGGNLINPETFNVGGWTVRDGDITVAASLNNSPFGTSFSSTSLQFAGSGSSEDAVSQLMDGTGGTLNMPYTAAAKHLFSVYVEFPTGTGTYRASPTFLHAGLVGTGPTFVYNGTTGTVSILAGTSPTSSSFGTTQGSAQHVVGRWFRLWCLFVPSATGPYISGTPDKVHVRLILDTPAGATAGAQMLYRAFGARMDLGYDSPPVYMQGNGGLIEALTVKDFTWILNPEVPVLPLTTPTAAAPSQDVFYLWVRQGSPKTEYRIRGSLVGGSTFDLDTDTWGGPGTLVSGEITTYEATAIATDLATQLTATGLFSAVLRKDSVIRVTCASGANNQIATLVTACSQESDFVLLFERVRDRSDIPENFFHGAKFAVGEDSDLATPPYYLVFTAKDQDSDGYGKGEVAETNGFNVPTAFVAASMPHGLTRMVDNAAGAVTGIPNKRYFSFGPITWDTRLKGDTSTNPDPSFVSTATENRYIRSIAIVQNRLAVTSRDNIVMTESGVFTNWFRTTVRDARAGDPIDNSANDTNVVEFDSIVEAQGRTFLRAPGLIKEIDGEPLLSALTLEARSVCTTNSDSLCKPVVVSDRIIVVDASEQRFSMVKELVPYDQGTRLLPTEMSAEVLDYIEGRILMATASEQLGMLAFVPYAPDLGTPSPTVYLNNFFWDGPQKYQNAWWKLTLGATHTVRAAQFIDTSLYLVVEYGGSTHLERVVFDMPRQLTANYQPIVDGRMASSAVVLTFAGSDTTCALPYTPGTGDSFVFVADGVTGNRSPGDIVEGTLVGSTITWANQNLTLDSGWVGRKVRRYATFPKVRPKETSNERGRHATTHAMTQMYHAMFDYSDTGHIRAIVEAPPAAGSPFEYVYDSDTGSGDPPLNEGQWKVWARGHGSRVSLRIDSDSVIGGAYHARPFVLTSGEWYMNSFAKGRRSNA